MNISANPENNVLDLFDPMIVFEEKNEVSVVTFDSNFRNDLNREAKILYLKDNFLAPNCSLAVSVEDIEIVNEEEGMQIVEADVYLHTQSGENKDKIKLHNMRLALPAISKNDDKFVYLSRLDLTLTLKDKVVDSAAKAMEACAYGGRKNEEVSKIAALNPWNEVTNTQNLSILGVIKTWSIWKKLTVSVVSVLVIFSCLAYFKNLIFATSGINETVLMETQNNSESLDAQVRLTRETLKGMGLDPTKVQNDLGCLAK